MLCLALFCPSLTSAVQRKKDSGAARVLGSGTSGILELVRCSPARLWGWLMRSQAIFHPVDTISKRLMSNKAKVRALVESVVADIDVTQLSTSTLSAVIFREHASKSAGGKFLSLFPGLGYAAGYSASTSRINWLAR